MRWMPDEAVTESVLDGRQGYADLSVEDSRWVVADLSSRGYSVAEIAGWLRCSTRQVKRVRAELLTRVMEAFCGERAVRWEQGHQAVRLGEVRRELRRLQEENVALQSEVSVLGESVEAARRRLSGRWRGGV